MLDNDLISIAMCTYNGDRFIEEQIDSILNQSYKNIELIITDDCSSDKTVEIIQKYQKYDDRVKLYQNKKNLGFIKNFERAISLCTGNYIALSDQDDIWKKNKLKVFIDSIGENVLIYSDASLIDEFSVPIDKNLIRPHKNLIRGSNSRAFLLANCISGNTLMFKKELVAHLLPIPNDISYHDVWIAFVATVYGTITFTDESMTYYRRYVEQITKTRDNNYGNFFVRLKKKKKIRLDSASKLLKDLESFLGLSILKDEKTIQIIEMLINHFGNYEHIYYNMPLHRILTKYQDEIFEIRKNNKKVKYTAMGLKLHVKTFFIF